jgi:DNA mismatch repair protein MutS
MLRSAFGNIKQIRSSLSHNQSSTSIKSKVHGSGCIDKRNLELSETMRKRQKSNFMGTGQLCIYGRQNYRKWKEQPLINISDINERLEAVSEIKEKFMYRVEIRELLKRVYDIERLIGKVILGNVNCRDLIALKNSIGQIPYIKNLLNDFYSGLLVRNNTSLDTLDDIYHLIERAVIDEPPVSVKEGGIIKDGYDSEVDKLRKATTEGKNWVAALESSEREKTGIKNLKVGFNKVFGYYIEVTKSYYSLVPESYIRKQTLANCERYITQDLKEIEDTILGAEEKVVDLEYKLFLEIKEKVASQVIRIKNTARSIAEIDVICSLAETADRESYCMPEITQGDEIDIVDGRHPVVEKMSDQEAFVLMILPGS